MKFFLIFIGTDLYITSYVEATIPVEINPYLKILVKFMLQAVFRIRDILVRIQIWIQIIGYVPYL
jgi:hypothetical protein